MKKGWIWLSTKIYTVALDVEDDRITKTAPIIKWARGLSPHEVRRRLYGKILDWREFPDE